MKRTTHVATFAGGLLVSLGVAAMPRSSPPTLRTLYGVRALEALETTTTALVLVDFQEEFVHGRLPLPDGPQAAARAAQLLAWARTNHLAVVHVRNLVARKGSPIFAPESAGAAFLPATSPAPAEAVITKPSGGAFTNTPLDAWLRARRIDTVVVAGLMSHLAVYLTAADATVLGYRTVVASDATATRDLPDPSGGPTIGHRVVHAAALASIADRFADVFTVARIQSLRLETTNKEPRP